jgi:hypothetical protein
MDGSSNLLRSSSLLKNRHSSIPWLQIRFFVTRRPTQKRPSWGEPLRKIAPLLSPTISRTLILTRTETKKMPRPCAARDGHNLAYRRTTACRSAVFLYRWGSCVCHFVAAFSRPARDSPVSELASLPV